MTHAYRWIEDEKLCLVRYEGEMDAEAFIAADREVFGATTGTGVRFLFDLREVLIQGGAETSRKYAAWLSEVEIETTHPGAQQVILVEDPRETGLSMLMAAISEPGMEFEIYSTIESACRALGVDPEILEEHRDLIPE